MIPNQNANTVDKNCQHSEAAEQPCRSSVETFRNIETESEPTVELSQKLMVADEVYLYKIPPLQTSGGHRYVFIS
jgi:hypothetical protein